MISDYNTDFDRMQLALARLGSRAVRIVATRKVGTVADSIEFRLAQSGRNLQLRVITPRTVALDRTDYTYTLVGSKLTGMDLLNNEFIRRTAPSSGTPIARLAKVLNAMDESVRLVANPADAKDLATRLKKESGWKNQIVGSTSRWTRGTEKQGIVVEQRKADGLPSLVRFRSAAEEIRWQYSYGASTSVSAPATAGFISVDSFIARPALPRFPDLATENAVRTFLTAQKKFQRGSMVATNGTKLYLNGASIGEDSGKAKWRYDGKDLVATNGTAWYRGRARRRDVGKLLGELLPTAISTYARELLNGRAPYRYNLSGDMQGRLVGELTLDGRKVNIFEFTNPQRRFVFQIDSATKLVKQLESEVKDRQGRAISRSKVAFQYQTGARAIPAIALPAKAKWRALPKLDQTL